MRLKSFVNDLLPPILAKAIQRARGPAGPTGPKLMLSDGSYQVDFTRVDVGEDTYFVPAHAHSRPASRSILAGKYYEPITHGLVGALLEARPGDMVHAGTFFGDMLPSFSRKCPGTVYAFEPVLENYILAKQCVEANRLANVVMLNAALGSRISVCHITIMTDHGEHRGGTSRVAEQGQPSSLLTIDSLGLQDLSVLQLDVEGHELEALKGAGRTIGRCHPFILVEDNLASCPDYLSRLGYREGGTIPGLSLWADDHHISCLKDTAARFA